MTVGVMLPGAVALLLPPLLLGELILATDAVVCKPGHIQCYLQDLCLPPERVCDGVRECNVRSEEDTCTTCGPNASLCGASTRCVADIYRCDGHWHCEDGADERTCKEGAAAVEQFFCWRSNTYRSGHVGCDGIADCPGAEDESNCTICKRGAFKCKWSAGSRCLPAAMRCNGVVDCPLASDEVSCPERQPLPPPRPEPWPQEPRAAELPAKASSGTPGPSTGTASSATSPTTRVPDVTPPETKGASAELSLDAASGSPGAMPSAASYAIILVVAVIGLGGATAAVLWIRRRNRHIERRNREGQYDVAFSSQSYGHTENSYAEIAPMAIQTSSS